MSIWIAVYTVSSFSLINLRDGLDGKYGQTLIQLETSVRLSPVEL